MQPLLPYLAVFLGVLAVGGLALGFTYRQVFLVHVCAHFGEEFPSRRDRAATARRRTFEWFCGQAATCLYFSGVANSIGGLLAERSAELSHWAMWIQYALWGIAALLIWAAVRRWREPFEN